MTSTATAEKQTNTNLGKIVTLWCLVYMATFSLMIYECQKVAREFVAGPVSVNLAQTHVGVMPLVTVCPRVWVNDTRLAQYGDPLDVYKFLISRFLTLDVSEAKLLTSPVLLTSIGFMPLDSGLLQGEKRRLDALFEERLNQRFGTFLKFMLDIMLPAETVVTPLAIDADSVAAAPTVRGGCYQLNDTTEVPFQFAPYKRIMLKIPSVKSPFDTTPDHHKLYFGDAGATVIPDGYVDVAPGSHVTISLAASRHSSVNTRRKPCRQWSYVDWLECGYACYNAKACKLCKLPTLGHNFSGICSYYDRGYANDEHCSGALTYNFVREQTSICLRECPPNCEGWSYRPSVSPMLTPTILPVDPSLTSQHPLDSYVTIKSYKAAHVQYLVESEAYT